MHSIIFLFFLLAFIGSKHSIIISLYSNFLSDQCVWFIIIHHSILLYSFIDRYFWLLFIILSSLIGLMLLIIIHYHWSILSIFNHYFILLLLDRYIRSFSSSFFLHWIDTFDHCSLFYSSFFIRLIHSIIYSSYSSGFIRSIHTVNHYFLLHHFY